MTLLSFGNFFFEEHLFMKSKWYYMQSKKEMSRVNNFLETSIKKIEEKIFHNELFEIEIIIPIFNSLEDFQQCISSVIKYASNSRIILINDSSNNVTTQYLRKLAFTNDFIYLVENYKNMGYTKSINRGLKLSTSKYVITLNSDTIVSKGWLNKMVNVFNTYQNVGIVGPLSNAATWQNIPMLKDANNRFVVNDLPENFTVGSMASLIEKYSNKVYPKVDLLNGFCMMIKREVIEKIGYMDEEFFPLGYGEETDYCIRAKKAGFDLRIADNVYIYHAKSKSFGNEKRKELSIRGEEALKYKHGEKEYKSIKNSMDNNVELARIRANILDNLLKENNK